MIENKIVYNDMWGEIVDRNAYVELRWFDTTASLSREAFNRWLALFAGHVEALGRRGCLVDGVQFQMDRAHMDGAWRDENIIPRYNAAGVEKFAFHMPAGMPAIGAPPAPEGPANFPTAYFGTRADAIAWLTG